MAKGTLKEAMQYAAKNPQSDFARQLRARIDSGAADEEARQLNVNLSPFGRDLSAPAPAPEAPAAAPAAKTLSDVVMHKDSPGPTLGGTIKNAFKGGIGTMDKAIGESQAGRNPIETGLKFGMGAVQAVSSPLAPLFTPFTGAIQAAGDALSETKPLQEWGRGVAEEGVPADQQTGAERIVEGVANASTLLGATVGGPKVGSAAEATLAGAKKLPGAAGKAAVSVGKGAVNIAKEKATTGIFPESVRDSISGMGVNPQLRTSVERLRDIAPPKGGPGAAVRKKLHEVYDDFVGQENKHIADIHADPAISLVGERIGDAFEKVMKHRGEVGKTMRAELEKTGKNPVPTGGAFSNLQRELLDNGVEFDAVKKELRPTDTSKFASDDLSIMETYASQLQKLGSEPTMGQLDAFVSRIPKEIEGLKATRNIKFKTNAERIVSSNLRDLREALGKAGTEEYRKARASYADLSNFLDEGGNFLGKKTQSGDYARDASMAKSAVQSALNAGKKDWLMKLEALTEYPALDESILALQAMKDLGDAKGASLLELLTEGSVKAPTTAGIKDWIVGMTWGGAKRAAVGTPVERTRAFLRKQSGGSRTHSQ